MPSLDAGPSHAQVLVLHVCLIATLVLGQGLTWLYISFHPLSPSVGDEEEEEKVVNLTCHCGSQDPGYVASEEPRQ